MTSRLLFFIVSTFVLGLTSGCEGPCDHDWDGKPGSCQLPGAEEGTIGGSCRDGIFETDCDSGASCFNDVCIQCGGEGEPCCAQYSDNPKKCQSGTCVENSNDPSTCDNSCGLLAPGQDNCCEGDLCSEGVCDVSTNKCTAPVSDPCSGKNGYSVSLKDLNSCATEPIFFTSDNDTDAKTCAEAIRQQLGYPKACEVDQSITHTDVCGTALGAPPSSYVVVVCDQADFAACELSHCVNCTFTNGTCP
jgi:hypothetical protein